MRVISITAVAALAILVASRAGAQPTPGAGRGGNGKGPGHPGNAAGKGFADELKAALERCRPLAERASAECEELRATMAQMREGDDDAGSGSGMWPRKGPRDGGKKGGKKGPGDGGKKGPRDGGKKGGKKGGERGAPMDRKAGPGRKGDEGSHASALEQGKHHAGEHHAGQRSDRGGHSKAEMAGAAAGVVVVIVLLVVAVVVAVRKSRRSRAPTLPLTNTGVGNDTKPPAYAVVLVDAKAVPAAGADYREADGARASRVLQNTNYARPGSVC